MTSSSSTNLLTLLWNTESILRRQLQDDGDPIIYITDTSETNKEDSSQGSRGRTVLTILYLCVLGLCFVIPVFYYFRLHCFEEHARRELELDFTTALEQSEMHREENRAARRKYIEERRARIVQLLGPVRMILKEENFPHLMDPTSAIAAAPQRTGSFLNLDFESEKFGDNESTTMTSQEVFSPYTSDDEEDLEAGNHTTTKNTDDDTPKKIEDLPQSDTSETSRKNQHNPYGDEDTFFVRIPVPGLPMGGSSFLDPTRPQRHEDAGDRETRLTPGLCTICLSNYTVGSDIVWSSNEACDHHFHSSCIEKWLMKQREGPLCPCCRRDFVVDPLDLLEEEDNKKNDNPTTLSNPTMFSWDPEEEDDDEPTRNFGPIIVTEPGDGADNFAYDPALLEEGLNPPARETEPAVEERQEAEGRGSANELPAGTGNGQDTDEPAGSSGIPINGTENAADRV